MTYRVMLSSEVVRSVSLACLYATDQSGYLHADSQTLVEA